MEYGDDGYIALNRIKAWKDGENTHMKLDLRHLNIHTLPPIPNTVRFLYCGCGPLQFIHSLPNDLMSLTCMRCNITSLPRLPSGLTILDCEYTFLEVIQGPIPATIVHMNLSGTFLRIIPPIQNSRTDIETWASPTLHLTRRFKESAADYLGRWKDFYEEMERSKERCSKIKEELLATCARPQTLPLTGT
jgi:hypothetical protein